MATVTSTKNKLKEFYELVDERDVAMLTTRRPDGMLVTRPMATQPLSSIADLWFVTNIDTHKIDEIESDAHVNLGYYDAETREWVSVSGTATISQDRELIRSLHQTSWSVWFPNEGGDRNGGPDDPRIALILVTAYTVHYMKSKHTRPEVLFEIAESAASGDMPDVGREEHLSKEELR